MRKSWNQTKSNHSGNIFQFPQFFGDFDLNGILVVGFIQGTNRRGPGDQWPHGPAVLQHMPACGNGNRPLLLVICTWACQVASLRYQWGNSPLSSSRSAACFGVGELLPPSAGSSRFITRGDSVMSWDALLYILVTFLFSDGSHTSFPDECLAKPGAKF